MLWLRIVDAATASAPTDCFEAEFGSEVHIPGLLLYRDGAVVSRFTTLTADPSGLFKYTLRLRTLTEPNNIATEGKRAGYLFPGGPLGELLALFSLCLQARLHLLSTSTAALTDGIRPKTEYFPLRGQIGPRIDPIVFTETDRSFAMSLPEFLDEVAAVPARYHQRIVTAANHYALALQSIGVDDEMVFVRLVSAIETVARDQRIDDDPLESVELEQILSPGKLNEDQRDEVALLFKTRRSRVKFVEFLRQHSDGFFDAEPQEPAHTQITAKSLANVATAIYRARSGYLHNGDPMYLSRGSPMFPGWHTDATVGMTWGDRKFSSKQKLPYAAFFHRLVRYCLIRYIRSLLAAHSIS